MTATRDPGGGERGPIVVIGSKPEARLPRVRPRMVVTANAAVGRAGHYRSRWPVATVALVSSGGLKDDAAVRRGLQAVAPERIVVLGSRVADARRMVVDDLGVTTAQVIQLTERERFLLLERALGWRAYVAGLQRHRWTSQEDGITGAKTFVRALLDGRNPLFASTGVNAILYALEFATNDAPVVTCGIGLRGGVHFYRDDPFMEGRARVDRYVMRHLPSRLCANHFTTDEVMSRLAGITPFDDPVDVVD